MIWRTEYKVLAWDKNGNLVCKGTTYNEDAVTNIAAELRKGGYEVRSTEKLPVVFSIF